MTGIPASTVAAAGAEAKADRRRRLRDRVAVGVGWLVFLGAWELTARSVGAVMLPGPFAVVARMWEIVIHEQFYIDFQWSLLKTMLGYTLAGLLGVPIGYLMGRYRYWNAFFHDGVTVAGTIPPIAYAVFALIIFGISITGPVVAVALICIPYVALNVAEGVRSVDPDLLRMSAVYGRSGNQIRRHIVLPTVAPYGFSAVRLTFAVAWKVEALTEVFGGSNGVGHQIRRAYLGYSIESVLAWACLFIGLMIFIERFVLVRAEERFFRWRQPERTR